jgi:hypothetical protein
VGDQAVLWEVEVGLVSIQVDTLAMYLVEEVPVVVLQDPADSGRES